MMHGPYGNGFGGPEVLAGAIFCLFFFLLIIVGTGLLIWWFVSAQSRPKEFKETNVLQILNERYAKGEINKKEYEDMKKTLNIK